MPINLYWDDDAQTVFLMEVRGQWAWDDLHRIFATIKRLSQERNRTFAAILDISEGLQMPDGGVFSREGLTQFNRIMQNDGPRGVMVIVGMNALIRSIFETVTRLSQSATNGVQFAPTLADARKIVYALN